MKKTDIAFIEGLKSNKKILQFDEASTKQAIIMRILSSLGWDIFNIEEVTPDISVKSDIIDYALKIKNSSVMFILVKKPSEQLDSYQKSFLTISARQKVDLALLTNGIAWWGFLSSAEGGVEDKKFFTANLLQDDIDEICTFFSTFIAKSSLVNGNSHKAAEEILETRKRKTANHFIPKAWEKIITQPHDTIIQLISQTAEDMCNYKPEKNAIIDFLKTYGNQRIISDTSLSEKSESNQESLELFLQESPTPVSPPKEKPKPINTYDGTIESFSFGGNTYEVGSWDDMLMTLCEIMVTRHKDNFDKVLWLSGQNRSYFSNIESELRNPVKIKRTNIFVEKRLGGNETVSTAHKLLSAFGYNGKDLEISVKKE